jgi:DoxX-like family
MNLTLWVLQILLALHTLLGALWKLSNPDPAQAAPSLAALPHGLWPLLAAAEVLCAAGLVLPAWRKAPALLAPVAALCLLAEMVLFTAVHFARGAGPLGQPIYWLVVAALCGFVAYGRLVRWPVRALQP